MLLMLFLKNWNHFIQYLKESFHTISEYLKQHIVEDDRITKSCKEATHLIKKVKLEIQNLKDTLFLMVSYLNLNIIKKS